MKHGLRDSPAPVKVAANARASQVPKFVVSAKGVPLPLSGSYRNLERKRYRPKATGHQEHGGRGKGPSAASRRATISATPFSSQDPTVPASAIALRTAKALAPVPPRGAGSRRRSATARMRKRQSTRLLRSASNVRVRNTGTGKGEKNNDVRRLTKVALRSLRKPAS